MASTTDGSSRQFRIRLVCNVDVAFVMEDAAKQCNIASSFDGITVEITTGTRLHATTQKFRITVLRPVFARTATTRS
eukprot:scaffold22759_cov54-Attheya_sp.AAC.6